MPFDAHKNFGYSTVAVVPSPAASGLTLAVAAGDGSKFPTAPFNAVVWPTAVLPLVANAEIVRVTGIAGDVLTIVRAQEGSSARTVLVGDQIAATVTAKTLTDIETAIGASGLTSFQGRTTAAAVLTKADVTGTGLAAADVAADASGAATGAVTAHVAASDPHGDRAFASNALATALAGLAPAEFPAVTQGSGIAHTGIGQTVGGVVITAGMRVLDTAAGVTSGLWVAASGAWTRPVDFATGSNAQGKLVDVDTGGIWLCVSSSAVTVDTTSQVWTEIDASVIQAGTGLSKTGNTLSLALTKVLVTATGLAAADVGAMANPMTTAGDLVLGGAAGAPTRLAEGSNGNFLQVAGGAVVWSPLPSSVVSSSSWVDMCRAPYNCTPGTDITSALQTAINAANTANQDTTLYFSTSGTYNINGALQSGSGTVGGKGYTYNGQINLPARDGSVNGIVTVTIRGAAMPPIVGQWGVVLQSNMNTAGGSIFDAIAGYAQAGTYAATGIGLVFQDITILGPSNPQGSGIRGTNLYTLCNEGEVSINGGLSGWQASALTGAGTAIQFPPYNNGGLARASNLIVNGYPVGVGHSEHFHAIDLQINGCQTGIQPNPSGGPGHGALYDRALVQGTQYVIAPTGGPMQINGFLDIADTNNGYILTWVVNDPGNSLYGTLQVKSWGNNSSPGFPVNGGQNLVFLPTATRPSGWPSDDFSRVTSSSAAYIGASSNTHHAWNITNGAFTTTGGVLKATTSGGSGAQAFIVSRLGRPGRSRGVRMIVTPSGTYNVGVICGRPLTGTKTANWLQAAATAAAQGGNANTVGIYQNVGGAYTLLAVAPAALLASGTQATVDAIVSNPIGGSMTLSVVVNGVTQPLTISAGGGSLVTVNGVANGGYQLSATEIGNVAETDKWRTQDGLTFGSDNASSVAYFAVQPN